MRDIFEIIYFISGPLLVLTGGLILWQIKIAKQNLLTSYSLLEQEKKDLQVKSKRDSIEKSCQQIEKYFKEIVPLRWELVDFLKSIQFTNQKINSFTRNDIRTNPDYKNWLDKMNTKTDETDKSIALINKLETFSLFFTKGIADEQVAFSSISTSYIEIIEELYPLICLYRPDNRENSYFNDIIELYKLWKERINNIEDLKNKDAIEKELILLKTRLEKQKEITSKPLSRGIKPLGTDDE